MAQPLSVVHITVSGEAFEHGLPQQPDQRMAAVLAGAGVDEHLARRRGKAERVVEVAVGEQSSIGGDPRAMELKLDASKNLANSLPF